jgi:hypothetical protein
MADRRRIAAALEYLGAMRDRAAEFGSGVAGTLANRARDVGGLAYEALTSDPNIGRMNTAEFAQAAASRAPTPRLDAAGQGAVELGRAVLTQPVQTGKALVRDQVNAFMGAFDSPRAMGEYAGSMVNPLRLASALRRPPMQELDVYHGTPHRFPSTEANPLGELDASKIGSGEGAQAYGHGIYLAENPRVAGGYRNVLSDTLEVTGNAEPLEKRLAQMALNFGDNTSEGAIKFLNKYEAKGANHTIPAMTPELVKSVKQKFENGTFKRGGALYTLDLPDEMIDRMLDYDKPLSEQTQSVRDAFASLGFDVNTIKFKTDDELHKAASKYLRSKEAARLVNSDLNAADDIYAARRAWNAGPQAIREYVNSANGTWLKGVLTGAKGADMSGGVAYQKLADLMGGWGGMVGQGGGQSSASRKLAELGIPGIRYLDAGSRGKDGTGTRNFVVFPGEEKKVKILRRE